MLTTSVLIVLHEVLEAAFMISALLALTVSLRMSPRWILRALLGGFFFAAIYAYSLRHVSNLLGGAGQEAVNVCLQIVSYGALLVCVFLAARERFGRAPSLSKLPAAMTLAVGCAIALEGSEILVYVAGFLRSSASVVSASIGSIVGLCIGLSIGVLFYHLLQLLSPARSRALILFFTILVGTGMSAQATREIIQANWLNVGHPLWDTSHYLPEESIVGQVLFALSGYEATPSAIEVWSYILALSLMTLALLAGRWQRH